MDVYLSETQLYSRSYMYTVWVDGEPYTQFRWNDYPLTWSQQFDCAGYFKEALS